MAEPRGNGVPGFLIHASRFRCCLAEDSCNDTSECADEESGFLVGAACPPAAAHAPLPAGPPGPLRQKGARRGRLPGSQHQSASIAPRGSTPVVSSPLHAALRPPGDPSPSGLSTSDHPSSSTPTPGSPSSWVPETLARAFWGGGERRAALLRDAMGVMRSHPAQRLPPRHLPCARPSPPRALAARALPRPERAGGRRWAQWAQGRPPPAQPRGQRPPAKARLGLQARAEVIALSCFPSEINAASLSRAALLARTGAFQPRFSLPGALVSGAGVRRWLAERGLCQLASSVGFEESPREASSVLAASLFFTITVLPGTSWISASEIRQLYLANLHCVLIIPGKAEGTADTLPPASRAPEAGLTGLPSMQR